MHPHQSSSQRGWDVGRLTSGGGTLCSAACGHARPHEARPHVLLRHFAHSGTSSDCHHVIRSPRASPACSQPPVCSPPSAQPAAVPDSAAQHTRAFSSPDDAPPARRRHAHCHRPLQAGGCRCGALCCPPPVSQPPPLLGRVLGPARPAAGRQEAARGSAWWRGQAGW